MGHLGRMKEEYRDLVHRLQTGTTAFVEPEQETARRAFQELLELLFTPEEAKLAAKLPTLPSRIERIAERVGEPAESLRPKLEALCDKGLVMDLVSARTGKTKYMLAPPVVGFFEFSLMRRDPLRPQKEIADAIRAYAYGDDTFAKEVFDHPTVLGRALPYEQALSEDDLPEVLDWERATTLVREAKALSVSLCFCRHAAEHQNRACDAPVENCLSLNAGAEYVVRRKFGRAIDAAEAVDLLTAARERGLVQIADNVQRKPAYICNCCGCCCEQLHGINEFGLHAVTPSGWDVHHDGARCAGCSRCARACPIGAIQMVAHRVPGQRKAGLQPHVDPDRCIGCGVCTAACNKKCLALARAPNRPRVPKDAVEKALRMALERGRLADFVFDEGSGRGARFLNRVMSALLALPPARRALANEQLKSRFVQVALSRVKDPTS